MGPGGHGRALGGLGSVWVCLGGGLGAGYGQDWEGFAGVSCINDTTSMLWCFNYKNKHL